MTPPKSTLTAKNSARIAPIIPHLPFFEDGQPHVVQVTITPAIAAEWLLRNTDNRPLRRSHVEFLKQQLRGRYYFPDSNNCIAFDSKGILADGQHRLTAIVETGVQATHFVMVNQHPETRRHATDRNAPRSLSDMSGLPRPIVQMATFIHREIQGNRLRLDTVQLFKLYNAHRTAMDWLAAAWPRSNLFGKVAVRVALIEMLKTDPLAAKSFIIRLIDGIGLSATDPVRLLRNYLMCARNKPKEIYWKTISATRAALSGRELTCLRRSGERRAVS